MRTSVSLATDNLVWYRAVTLSERLARGAPADVSDPSESIEHIEPDVERRLQFCLRSWTSQKPFDRAEYFQQRLALDNLTESDLRRLICESVADIRARVSTAPDWVRTIEDALSSAP